MVLEVLLQYLQGSIVLSEEEQVAVLPRIAVHYYTLYITYGHTHCKNSIGILTIEYGYLSFMFHLSTPGTEQM